MNCSICGKIITERAIFSDDKCADCESEEFKRTLELENLNHKNNSK